MGEGEDVCGAGLSLFLGYFVTLLDWLLRVLLLLLLDDLLGDDALDFERLLLFVEDSVRVDSLSSSNSRDVGDGETDGEGETVGKSVGIGVAVGRAVLILFFDLFLLVLTDLLLLLLSDDISLSNEVGYGENEGKSVLGGVVAGERESPPPESIVEGELVGASVLLGFVAVSARKFTRNSLYTYAEPVSSLTKTLVMSIMTSSTCSSKRMVPVTSSLVSLSMWVIPTTGAVQTSVLMVPSPELRAADVSTPSGASTRINIPIGSEGL